MIPKIKLNDREFLELRDFIHQNFGLYFHDDKQQFINLKLEPRLISLGLKSFWDYLVRLKYEQPDGSESYTMIGLITNNESYFFRDEAQLRVLQQELLPQIKERKRRMKSHTIRILSAGCSTGEEVYTVAMLIYESGSFFWNWDIQIIGIDLSQRAIEHAQRGKYYQRSLRMLPARHLNKFFTKNCDAYSLKNSIMHMTRFVRGNILEEKTWQDLTDLDLILCRNVFIYFSEYYIRKGLDFFSRKLVNQGFLLAGHSEIIHKYSLDFELLRFPQTTIYKKRGL
ncbi:protein-glutamate O-methyltransferase CheR [bacterium]|nr:protein-glutamate O-methyltransferase CheR [bacterium]